MSKTMKKFPITKTLNFQSIIAHLSTLPEDEVLHTVTVGSGEKQKLVEVTAKLAIEMLSHEVDPLTAKNSADKALTEKQKQNNITKDAILAHMAGDPDKKLTITDMIKHIGACVEMTNQKVSAIVRQMVNEDGTMVRTIVDGKAMFSVATVTEVVVEDDLTAE